MSNTQSGLSTYHTLGKRMEKYSQMQREIRKQAELVRELEIRATEERMRLHTMLMLQKAA